MSAPSAERWIAPTESASRESEEENTSPIIIVTNARSAIAPTAIVLDTLVANVVASVGKRKKTKYGDAPPPVSTSSGAPRTCVIAVPTVKRKRPNIGRGRTWNQMMAKAASRTAEKSSPMRASGSTVGRAAETTSVPATPQVATSEAIRTRRS